uniref:Uncharacterized protein n=1 Tax=Anguilla anguilla TaxID=7936 RepID=A0A0E9PWQ0_ANGAN
MLNLTKNSTDNLSEG